MENNLDTNNVSKKFPDINQRIFSIIEKYHEGNVNHSNKLIVFLTLIAEIINIQTP